MDTTNDRPQGLKTFGAMLLFLAVTACGGSDNSRLDRPGNGGSPTPDPDDGDNTGGGTLQLGRGSGDDFLAGEIAVGIGDNKLSAGGQTSLSVTLVDGNNELVTEPVDVTFASNCLSNGTASLVGTENAGEAEEGGNKGTVTTDTGQATVTYRANGCTGEDRVTARAELEGSVRQAEALLVVENDTVQSLTFVSATPEIIGIKETGQPETSRVTFQVTGQTGAPVSGVDVSFSLSTTVGGVNLVNEAGKSDERGQVSTTVQAGTVPHTVRVTASTSEVSTQSSGLAISTGIPDQNSMSLSTSVPFPNGWGYDGVESEITIRMADAFNNPPPDGTAAYFTTSGGAIESQCLTENGACTVTWESQAPRPGDGQAPLFWVDEPIRVDDPALNIQCPAGMSECRHGRVKVRVTAQGNESFIDETGTGLYDGPPDIFATGGVCEPNNPISSASAVPEDSADIDGLACDDLGEAYLDKNFNGERNTGEEYADDNDDNQHTAGDGIYNGVLCSDTALANGDCTRETVTIRDDLMLVMACERVYTIPGFDSAPPRLPGQENVTLGEGESATVQMLLADCNGNGMPAGTSVSLNDSEAENVQASVFPDDDLTGQAEPSIVEVTITADEDDEEDVPAGGYVRISIEAPFPDGTTVTTYTSIEISAR